MFSDLYNPQWRCFWLCVFISATCCKLFLVLFHLCKNTDDCVEEIGLFELESVAGCKLSSAIHFSECCWERDRKPSGTAAELSPLLPRAGPGSVLCTPLWAADKVCPGHRDAHRGECNQFCVTYCLAVALASPAPLKWNLSKVNIVYQESSPWDGK